LAEYVETKDWSASFLKVLPSRKDPKLAENQRSFPSDKNEEENTQPNDKKNEDVAESEPSLSSKNKRFCVIQ
jgi:hypothetical protein